MKIRIQTTQNVDLEYEIAGIGYRFIAALIDLLVILGYVMGVFILIGATEIDFGWGTGLLFLLPILLYPVVCEVLMDGQTFGKKGMKLKVVKKDGSQPTLGDYLLRWLLWLVEANPLLGIFGFASIAIISIIFTRYGQRLGDLAANTTVVRMTPTTEIEEMLFRPVGPDYTLTWPQVTLLNDRDVTVIRKGFEAVAKGAEPHVLATIAYKVADVLGIERSEIGMSERFLKTVINDYTAATGQMLDSR